jgi:hypothetical protein
MADKKISQLTSATTPLSGTEVVPVVQSGSTVKTPVSDLTAGRAVSMLSATLSGGTVNGVLYLNAGKVATSGSALAFDGTNLGIGAATPAQRLDVRGNIALSAASATVNGFQEISFPAGIYGKAAIRGISIGTTDAGALAFLTAPAGDVPTERMRLDSNGNVVAGGSVALATAAINGFLYVPTCAGTPTGTPTAITGMAPIVVNTTNNKLYFYSGGAWRDAGP